MLLERADAFEALAARPWGGAASIGFRIEELRVEAEELVAGLPR